MALRLVVHAFQTIFGNLRQALVLSAGPFVILLILNVLVARQLPDGPMNMPTGGDFLTVLLFFVVSLALTAYVAAGWHRYVLLEEQPQVFTAPAAERTLSYAGKSILLGLWLLIFIIPVMLALGAVAMIFLGPDRTMIGTGAPGYGLGDLIFELILGTVIGGIALTYALVLPASALGQQMTFRQSREATSPLRTDLFIASFTIVMLGVLANLVFSTLFGLGLGIIATVFSVAVQWFTTMVGISILTTLYGHLVEGRALPN
jgi:hypothetical protein